MIGIDPPKTTHAAVAVDEDENVIGELTLRSADNQAERLKGWAEGFGKREWAVEVGKRPWLPDLPTARRLW